MKTRFLMMSALFTLCMNMAAYAGPAPDYNAMNWPDIMPNQSSNISNQNEYVYTKGIGFYSDFPEVPDFLSFAKMGGLLGVVYPTKFEDFYYLENPSAQFTYKAKIFDYINVKPEKMASYKTYLKNLGFDNINLYGEVKYGNYKEYFDVIEKELLFDPDFKIDWDNRFIMGNESEFTLVLMGKSFTNTNDIVPKMVSCDEIRIYSLKMNFDANVPLTSFVVTQTSDLQGKLIFSRPESGTFVTGDSSEALFGQQVVSNLPGYSSFALPKMQGVQTNGQVPIGNVYSLPSTQGGVQTNTTLPNGNAFVQPNNTQTGVAANATLPNGNAFTQPSNPQTGVQANTTLPNGNTLAQPNNTQGGVQANAAMPNTNTYVPPSTTTSSLNQDGSVNVSKYADTFLGYMTKEAIKNKGQ